MRVVPDPFLGDGLIYEEVMPAAWSAGPLPPGVSVARLNRDNQQLLSAESSVDDVRAGEALKEESPALLHELQRLEFKLNILLRLVAELAVRNNALPQRQTVRLSAVGMEWFGEQAPSSGERGLLSLYVNPAVPQPLKIPAQVVSERAQDGVRVAVLQFEGLSETVVHLLEKLIFRHHRRLVAGARHAPV